jgi:hypothetical protein
MFSFRKTEYSILGDWFYNYRLKSSKKLNEVLLNTNFRIPKILVENYLGDLNN